MAFEQGQVGFSSFVSHNYLHFPNNSNNFDDYYDEAEVNFSLAYTNDNIGLQVGGHMAWLTYRPSSSIPAPLAGFDLHGYFTSPNGNKFGGLLIYLDRWGTPQYNDPVLLYGVEALVTVGPVDFEVFATSVESGSYELINFSGASLYLNLSETFEISAHYDYTLFSDRYSFEFYSIGAKYTLPNRRISLEAEYSKHRNYPVGADTYQVGITYHFGNRHAGRMFSDKTSGTFRFFN